jgi:hypothetical protein
MFEKLSQEQLKAIDEQLAEYAVGYSGFLSWARGDILEEDPYPGPDEPWRASFLVFAGKGRAEVYQNILTENQFPIDPYTLDLLEKTSEELDAWLNQSWNEVARQFESAFPFLLKSFHNTYLKAKDTGVGWDFDDFMDERDLLEFFLIGLGDILPIREFTQQIERQDVQIRQCITKLGLEDYETEFFPGRIAWYPERFWWHHPASGPAGETS